MDTVTTTPAYGTVEYYVAQLRRNTHRGTDVRLHAIEVIGVIALGLSGDEHGDLQRIRNVLAAAVLVRAEFAAAGR